jgi:hypothetical protein
MWFAIEINSIIFLIIIIKSSTNLRKSPSLIYLIIRFLSSIAFIYSFVITNNLIMEISLLIKIGIPPFQYWIIITTEEIRNKIIWILTGLQKLPPLILSSTFIKRSIINITIILSFLYITTNFIKFSSLKKILFISSISTGVITLILSTLSLYTCLIFITFYTWNIIILTYSIEMKNIENHKNNPETYLLIINFSGIPPLPIFWIKVLIVKIIISSQPIPTILAIITLTSIIIFIYLRNTIIKTLTNKYKKYIKPKELITLIIPILIL